MKKFLTVFFSIVLVFALIFYTPIGTMAFSYFAKQIAGLAQDNFTNEVTVVDTHASGNSKYTISIQSNAQTIPAHVYTVYLYFDDIVQPITQTVSWTVAEIPGTIKKVTFTGLNMSGVSVVEPEIRG